MTTMVIEGVEFITAEAFEKLHGVKLELNYWDKRIHFQMVPLMGGFESIAWVPTDYLEERS